MKKRNYVVAISLIAMLAQSSGLYSMGWARGKAGQAKAATVDALYKKAKAFVKEVKTLKQCHKDGDCTPAQYRKIKRLGAGLAVTATAVAAATAATISLGLAVRSQAKPEGLYRMAMSRFKVYRGNKYDVDLVRAAAFGEDLSNFIQSHVKRNITDKAVRASIWVSERRGDTAAARFLKEHFSELGPRAIFEERVSGEEVDLP